MKILAIETSCDETGIALIEAFGTARTPRFRILKNIVSSQIPVHRPFGGVVPNLAKREHLKNLPVLWKRIMNNESRMMNPTRNRIIHNSRFKIHGIDLIAVTVGPGLEPALWTGIEFAKKLSEKLNVPLVGANHLEGHLYSFLASKNKSHGSLVISPKSFPAIALIVSGGHTILLKLDSLTKWRKLGETRDDAAGEAFDKVARMLGLPYPGGPEISRLAEKGNAGAIKLPRPMIHDKNYDFSFSGLKTAVLYHLRDQTLYPKPLPDRQAGYTLNPRQKADVAASFQQAVMEVFVTKTMRAAREFGARSVILCGGVAANKLLRKTLALQATRYKLHFLVPPNDLNGDNATMIAIAAYLNRFRKKRYKLAAQGNLNI